jgi:tetratricopeptide (TPR) repeat protein
MDPQTASSFGGYLHRQLFGDPGDPARFWVALNDDEHKVPETIRIAVTPSESWTLDPHFVSLPWKQSPGWFVHIHPEWWDRFQYIFYRNIQVESHYEMYLDYDNLLHLVMIVKNAGKGFAQILAKNIPHIDRWTILDTGSTDGTQEVIRTVLGTHVRGELYEEPFVDFGTSRNRALELAGEVCKYAIMLDDTYYITGDLRGFLNEIRSDQFADSYSLYVNSVDVQYASNRVLKTRRRLKYLFKIHEVVQEKDNVTVIIPPDRAQIHDEQSEYMSDRTASRKSLDLRLLRESIAEEPDNPRHWYYMAQTYVGMKDYEHAYRYFLARVFHPVDGFVQEKVDACFEAARTAQFQLHRPWEEVKPLYERAHAMDPSRPDSTYFLAIHDYLEHQRRSAYEQFKKAFTIGYPLHAQYSLKPTLSFHFTPKFLAELCYEFRDYRTGLQAAQLYAEKNPPDALMQSWYAIYQQMVRWENARPAAPEPLEVPRKPRVAFVADGNWTPWTGADILEKGLGGSETYIVEMARWIQRSGEYDVVVFCRSSSPDEPVWYENVEYRDLKELYAYVHTHALQSVVISRPRPFGDGIAHSFGPSQTPTGVYAHRLASNALCRAVPRPTGVDLRHALRHRLPGVCRWRRRTLKVDAVHLLFVSQPWTAAFVADVASDSSTHPRRDTGHLRGPRPRVDQPTFSRDDAGHSGIARRTPAQWEYSSARLGEQSRFVQGLEGRAHLVVPLHFPRNLLSDGIGSGRVEYVGDRLRSGRIA